MSDNLVWFVEDDGSDVLLIQRALRQSSLSLRPVFARDFEELQGLFEAAQSSGALPKIIVTDLKLTGEDGFTVLQWVKSKASLRNVPCIVLTSSTLPQDHETAMKQGAHTFLIKTTGSALSAILTETLSPLLN